MRKLVMAGLATAAAMSMALVGGPAATPTANPSKRPKLWKKSRGWRYASGDPKPDATASRQVRRAWERRNAKTAQ